MAVKNGFGRTGGTWALAATPVLLDAGSDQEADASRCVTTGDVEIALEELLLVLADLRVTSAYRSESAPWYLIPKRAANGGIPWRT